uniref:Uncharacterized protein n=1 Tax=Arundo donax TaxID=35708 RepID=A0A0A8YZB3_ARUDO
MAVRLQLWSRRWKNHPSMVL